MEVTISPSDLVTNALLDMNKFPEKYEKLNHPIGWGSYEGLLESLTKLRELAEKNPTYILKDG